MGVFSPQWTYTGASGTTMALVGRTMSRRRAAASSGWTLGQYMSRLGLSARALHCRLGAGEARFAPRTLGQSWLYSLSGLKYYVAIPWVLGWVDINSQNRTDTSNRLMRDSWVHSRPWPWKHSQSCQSIILTAAENLTVHRKRECVDMWYCFIVCNCVVVC